MIIIIGIYILISAICIWNNPNKNQRLITITFIIGVIIGIILIPNNNYILNITTERPGSSIPGGINILKLVLCICSGIALTGPVAFIQILTSEYRYRKYLKEKSRH